MPFSSPRQRSRVVPRFSLGKKFGAAVYRQQIMKNDNSLVKRQGQTKGIGHFQIFCQK